MTYISGRREYALFEHFDFLGCHCYWMPMNEHYYQADRDMVLTLMLQYSITLWCPVIDSTEFINL